ncbi:MAG: universal stress protein [Thermodesulfobacteriota bacterium]
MKNILLVLSTSRTSPEAVEYALALAKKEKARLITLFIMETEIVSEVFEIFSDIGFTGDKPSMRLTEAMMREFRQRGYEELKKIEDIAKKEGIPCELVIEEGDFLKKALWVMDKYGIDSAVAIKKRRSAIASYFIRSQVLMLKEKAKCPVEIFQEE